MPGVEMAKDLDAGMQMAYEKLPAESRVMILPDDGTLLPRPAAEKA